MKAPRKLFRPRALIAVAAILASLAVLATLGATVGETAVGPQARPVVDNEFLYGELYHLSTQFIYRVAGSDGPLADPTSIDNLPPNYNGAQEFYKWFGSELTNSDADHMGPLGRFMTARDHLYSTRTWQLNDEVVTIPGGTCAGQVVLIAGHNDATPTSTNVANGAASGSATPMNAMRGGNWGNGSMYDAGSGEAMGMAEVQALLRWYAANGTYPKRTIKIGLFDNEEGGLVGSGFYSQTNVTPLSAPAAAGDTNINITATTGVGLGAGRTILIDPFGPSETRVIASVPGGAAPLTATTLAAPSAVGDTNVKVTNVGNGFFVAGHRVAIDTGADLEYARIQTVGTAGAAGTGVTLTAPLTKAHASGARIQDLGAGVNLSAPLSSAHDAGSPVSAGIDDIGGLIPDGPQGQYVMVANMDQNGLEYPARHFGTDHYLNDIVGGGVGPWYTNINAVPLHTTPNNIYNDVALQRIQHNLPAVQAFRDATADAVSEAFQVLGQKYGFSMPLENPLRLDQVGSTPVNPSPVSVPAYQASDIPLYSPVVDDNLGRTDQVSFIRDWGIPGFGIVGSYDTSTNQAIGGNENPYPASYASKPTLGQYATYDTADDTPAHLNYFASGTTHGPGGVETPSEGLKRALELPATWTAYLIRKDAYAGAEQMSKGPVAYFETGPAKPFLTSTVSFDAGFSRDEKGTTDKLRYYWDFGDGTTTATSDPKVTHTFGPGASWYDVKLAVNRDQGWDFYRQAVAVRFVPTHFPDQPLANEPPPPATDACGTLTPAEETAITQQAQQAFESLDEDTTVVVSREP